jgi:IMP dehydrogenase
MILNNKTIVGEDINKLPQYSTKKVLRICDLCAEEKIVLWKDIFKIRKKHSITEDYCYKCAIKIYNCGENNPSKKTESRKKISESTKGKSKKFKDGKNLRILNAKLNAAGYILVYDEASKKYQLEHHKNIENFLERPLQCGEQVHHIDGDKRNNNINNLCLMNTANEHSKCHSQLQNLGYELYKNKVINFDKVSKKYFINNLFKPIHKSYGFDELSLSQNKNIVESRMDVDISSEIIRGVVRPIPLIASNMSTVCNADFCIELYKLGALGVMHRANSDSFILNEVKKISQHCELVAASIGVGDEQYKLAVKLIENGANIIVIDIAHGFSDSVINLGKKIKINYPNVKLVLGNTINTDFLYETYEFADAIKIGIAQGLACETKDTAGCTEKQLSCILKFKDIAHSLGIPIISDGGTRIPAHFTKAILAGANSVMAGSIFASCPSSAGEIVKIDGNNKKLYAGMASRYVQDKWKGGLKPGTCPEGKVVYLDIGESLENLLERYSGALKSGITYVGGKDIKTARENAEFIEI